MKRGAELVPASLGSGGLPWHLQPSIGDGELFYLLTIGDDFAVIMRTYHIVALATYCLIHPRKRTSILGVPAANV